MRRSRSSGGAVLTRRSRPHRNAARVLPDPVGARISVCSPEAMAGQPWACAAVGSAKVVENQARTAGENALERVVHAPNATGEV